MKPNSLTKQILKAAEFDLDKWHEEHSCYELFSMGAKYRDEQLKPLILALASAVEALEDVWAADVLPWHFDDKAEEALANLRQVLEGMK